MAKPPFGGSRPPFKRESPAKAGLRCSVARDFRSPGKRKSTVSALWSQFLNRPPC